MATEFHSDDTPLVVSTLAPDPRSALVLNSYLDADRLIGLAQPTIWSDFGIATAQKALQAAHAALVSARYLADLSAANRLQRAVTAANDIVLAANLARTGNNHEARVGAGLAICLRSGRKATVALNPPVQMLLFQGGNRTWFPSRESWIADDPGLPGTPLGWTATAAPTLVTTVIEHADEIILTTAQVAEHLARSGSEPNTPEAVCDLIAATADRHELDPLEVVALSTRFEPPSLAGNLRSATQHVLGNVDRRARAVWGALRSPA